MINNEPSVGDAERPPKAVMLMDRIINMDSIVSRLAYLRDRIQNGNIPLGSIETAKQDSPTPTVSAVLTEGPEMLQTCLNQINDIIEQIEKELF